MEIIQQVKELIQIDRLDSKDRYRDMIYKRSYLYAILRDEGWHLSKIGRLFNRNHATVINALKVHDAFYGRDKIYMRNVKHYDLIFRPIIEVQKDTIFDDVMNCHNTTALKIIKDKIMAGEYDNMSTLLLAVPTFFYFFVGGVEKMLVILS
jgi:hypothetical protein